MKFQTLNLFRAIFIPLVVFLASCGGGGGGGGVSGEVQGSLETTSVTIKPYKGPYTSGTITLKDANGNPITLISGGNINASGEGNVTYNAKVAYPLTVEVIGSYYNEVTLAVEAASAPLRGFIINANNPVPVTILTETAVIGLQNQIGPFSSSNPVTVASAVAALDAASDMMGIPAASVPVFDPITHKTSDANTLRLAAYAVAANGSLGTAAMIEKVKTLADTLAKTSASTAPTSVISQTIYNNALSTVTTGNTSIMAVGTSMPTPAVISQTGYSTLYAAATTGLGIAKLAGTYNFLTNIGEAGSFTVNSSGTVSSCTAGVLFACTGKILLNATTGDASIEITGNDGQDPIDTKVTLSGVILKDGSLSGNLTGTSVLDGAFSRTFKGKKFSSGNVTPSNFVTTGNVHLALKTLILHAPPPGLETLYTHNADGTTGGLFMHTNYSCSGQIGLDGSITYTSNGTAITYKYEDNSGATDTTKVTRLRLYAEDTTTNLPDPKSFIELNINGSGYRTVEVGAPLETYCGGPESMVGRFPSIDGNASGANGTYTGRVSDIPISNMFAVNPLPTYAKLNATCNAVVNSLGQITVTIGGVTLPEFFTTDLHLDQSIIHTMFSENPMLKPTTTYALQYPASGFTGVFTVHIPPMVYYDTANPSFFPDGSVSCISTRQ